MWLKTIYICVCIVCICFHFVHLHCKCTIHIFHRSSRWMAKNFHKIDVPLQFAKWLRKLIRSCTWCIGNVTIINGRRHSTNRYRYRLKWLKCRSQWWAQFETNRWLKYGWRWRQMIRFTWFQAYLYRNIFSWLKIYSIKVLCKKNRFFFYFFASIRR